MNDILFHAFIGLIVLLICMPVHECAHAFVAYKMGDNTPKLDGRITLNPLAHLDLMGSIFLIISSISGVGFGWAKPVMVNPNNFKNKKLGMGLTSLAGPASNFIMAFILMIIAKIILYLTGDSIAINMVFTALLYMIILNIGLAVFNFIPIPPLDGSKIFALLLPDKVYYKMLYSEKNRKISGVLQIVFIILIISGILSPVITFLQDKAYMLINFLTGFVDLMLG